jgi:hypothetical protein
VKIRKRSHSSAAGSSRPAALFLLYQICSRARKGIRASTGRRREEKWFELYQHHQIVQRCLLQPPSQHTLQSPNREPSSTGVRSRRNFVSIRMLSPATPAVNTWMPLCVWNSPGKTKLVRGSNVESRFAPAQSQHIFTAVRSRLDFAGIQEQSCVVAKPKKKSRNSRLAAFPQNAPRVLVYDALATLNRDFEQGLADLERLQGLRLFPLRWQRNVLKAWRAALEETRASVNFEGGRNPPPNGGTRLGQFRPHPPAIRETIRTPTDRLIPTKSSGW